MNWQERAEKAEAELERLRTQEPVTFVIDFNGYAIDGKHTEIANALPTGMDLYAAPVPAVAVHKCKGVPDRDCQYLAFCGDICNKCGRIHNPIQFPAHAIPVPAVAAPAVPEECQSCKKAWATPPIAWFRKRSDGGVDGPLMDDDSRMCATRRKEWTPLYERPFVPDWANYRKGFNDGIEDVRYELKQLCKDFSDRQNRPYMGDVYAQVDAICDRSLLQSTTQSEVRHD